MDSRLRGNDTSLLAKWSACRYLHGFPPAREWHLSQGDPAERFP